MTKEVTVSENSEIWTMNGIVDKVRAVRNSSDEVRYVEATVHVKMDESYKSQYGSDVTIDLPVPLPIGTGVNPGDVVSVYMQFVNPFGKRFMAALEMPDTDEQSSVSHESDDNDENLDEDDYNEAVVNTSQDA